MKLPPGYVPGQGVHKATAYGGFGEKLMKQMGWQEGHGLGRDQKGMKKAIEVKHKEDNIGVGGKAGFAWEKKWWEEAYDSKAKKIQALVEDLDSEDSDDDVIVDVNRDGTRSSAASHEQKIAAALAKDPWGRFGGREGKMARIAQQEAELLARLQTGQTASTSQSSGHADAAAAADTRAAAASVSDIGTDRSPGAGKEKEEEKTKKRKQVTEGSKEAPQTTKKKKAAGVHVEGEVGGATRREQQGADTAGAKAAKIEKKQQKKRAAEQETTSNTAACDAAAAGDNAPSRRQVHVVRLAKDDASTSAAFRSTAASGWWGASRFRSAGCLEGLEHTAEHIKKERQSFTEQTQEDLYTATQAAKATAKKGLGIASMPRKVAGARWQGTKVLIEEDAEEGTGPQAVDAAENSGAAEQPCLHNAKWKKLAKAALLKTADRCMTAKRLKREVVKAALEKAGVTLSKATRKTLQDAMLTKVSSSALFAVKDGIVQLC